MSIKSNQGGGQIGPPSNKLSSEQNVSRREQLSDRTKKEKAPRDHAEETSGHEWQGDDQRGTQPDRKPGQRDDAGLGNVNRSE